MPRVSDGVVESRGVSGSRIPDVGFTGNGEVCNMGLNKTDKRVGCFRKSSARVVRRRGDQRAPVPTNTP